ncbi:MAG TPA: DNA repair protein RecO [Ginsengibacter sp.]|nr:DNA repair protein RecO [Ginsengibacter sp.]
MIHTTKGIVLRSIKYGETSVIATIFTELFGIQSYIVNGVRTQSKSSKAHFFQSSSILEMQVYHNDLKNLQRIKELKWNYLYKNIFSNVTKNSVALFMVELLQKCLKQPEANADLFHFCEDAFIQLDVAEKEVVANYPIFFAIQLAQFFGLSIQDNYSAERNYFNVSEGNFTNKFMANDSFLETDVSYHFSQLLKVLHPSELKEIRLNKNIRKTILSALENYYMFHIAEFGAMKTLPVLHELLG